MKIDDLFSKIYNPIYGDFNNLSKFDFKGIYVIYDKDDEIVYVGSAYSRTIEQRLKQYISISDSGNTLGKTIAKEISNSKKFNDTAKISMDTAIKKIKNFKICALHYEDLEYKLINLAQPIYNNYGKDED